ncbi:hypothetical protein AVEN_113913-1 [Araneus ventricosus]|uniref:Uncharacterized protein n=1 Tax=Araneus ventricosus TaxID=182803 RepID=A0A4Y2LFA0_ARAVE|nr:hypothetical protein AVEN_113913-1 [Araneus ventricosus]
MTRTTPELASPLQTSTPHNYLSIPVDSKPNGWVGELGLWTSAAPQGHQRPKRPPQGALRRPEEPGAAAGPRPEADPGHRGHHPEAGARHGAQVPVHGARLEPHGGQEAAPPARTLQGRRGRGAGRGGALPQPHPAPAEEAEERGPRDAEEAGPDPPRPPEGHRGQEEQHLHRPGTLPQRLLQRGSHPPLRSFGLLCENCCAITLPW